MEVLARLCSKYHITGENVAYIGDDQGDMQAMIFAGVGICPCNAVLAIREAAEWILRSTDPE